MNLPELVSREEWVAARKKFLAEEKEFTRRRDALNADRRRLPMVRIDKDYAFEGPDGAAGLLDLFEGRLQLIVYASPPSRARRTGRSLPSSSGWAGSSPGTRPTGVSSTTTSMSRWTTP
jgi:predicted dithiol-disulfide oxidoreductase (DUF899 family)